MSAAFWLSAVGAFVGMEAFSYAVHRFLFHGPLWVIHVSHHRPRTGWFERNDVFSLGFALVAVGLILAGSPSPLTSASGGAGVGMTVYGLTYFLLHDMVTHGRFAAEKARAALNQKVVTAVSTAHRQHHRSTEKPGLPPYGFLSMK